MKDYTFRFWFYRQDMHILVLAPIAGRLPYIYNNQQNIIIIRRINCSTTARRITYHLGRATKKHYAYDKFIACDWFIYWNNPMRYIYHHKVWILFSLPNLNVLTYTSFERRIKNPGIPNTKIFTAYVNSILFKN